MTRLWAGQSRVRISVGGREFSVLRYVRTDYRFHKVSYSVGTEVVTWVQSGWGLNLIVHWMDLQLYVTHMPSLCRQGQIYPFFFFMVRQPLVSQVRLIFEASRSHSDAPHSVWLLWTGDQPDAGTSTWQNTALTGDRHPWHWRDSNPQSQQAKDRRPHDHWDHHYLYLLQITVLVTGTTCCNIKKLYFLNKVCICVFHWFTDTDYFPDGIKVTIFVMERPCVLWW